MNLRDRFERRVRISGNLVFETAFHIGSGKEGELATNMGVLKDFDGNPILPGSTIKGSFRSLCERLAPYLKLSACLLDSKTSGQNCVSDENYRLERVYNEESKKMLKRYEVFQELESEEDKLTWLDTEVCDVCKLFGSPLQASRIFFEDGMLLDWAGTVQFRDGVCIDRDSGTARPQAKYNFEVIPRGAVFSIAIEIENPQASDLALVGAALSEWEDGFHLGGFTSRGLGRVRLEAPTEAANGYVVESVDYTDPNQLRDYLLFRKMKRDDTLLSEKLQALLGS